MQETINEQQEEIDNFEADSSMTQATISEHLEQILALQQENAVLQTTITEMQALIATLEKENGTAKETISELQQNVTGLQQGNKSALMTISDLQQQIVDLIQKQESWGTEITSDFFGAYSITDECYKAYVRRSAASVGADDKWVSDALKDGQGGDWYYNYGLYPQEWYTLAYPKDTLNCVFANNQIAVDTGSTTIYNISKDRNVYQGASITGTITFWFDSDRLYLIDEYNKMWVFEKDDSYSFGESVKLESPQDIRVSINSKYIDFEWNYKSTYGTIGATADIKTANSQEYKTINHIDRVWMNSLVSQLERSQFEVGENFVRLYHLGGPKTKNNKTILVEENSDYVTFRVTIGEDGSVRVLPI